MQYSVLQPADFRMSPSSSDSSIVAAPPQNGQANKEQSAVVVVGSLIDSFLRVASRSALAHRQRYTDVARSLPGQSRHTIDMAGSVRRSSWGRRFPCPSPRPSSWSSSQVGTGQPGRVRVLQVVSCSRCIQSFVSCSRIRFCGSTMMANRSRHRTAVSAGRRVRCA